ncbi:MAG: hypothetical protein ACRCU3_10310 [Eubacteriaceae bacterium]
MNDNDSRLLEEKEDELKIPISELDDYYEKGWIPVSFKGFTPNGFTHVLVSKIKSS